MNQRLDLILVFVLFCHSSSMAQSPDKASIFESWKKVQNQATTVHVTWSETKTLMADSMTGVIATVSTRTTKSKPSAERLPTTDVLTTNRCELLIDGDCIRFNLDGSDWQYQTNTVEKRIVNSVRCRGDNLELRGDPGGGHRGFKNQGSGFKDAKSYILLPLLLTYRPLDPELGPFSDASDWELDSDSSLVGSDPCFILESHAGNLQRRAWVSKQGNLVRKFEVLNQGKPTLTINCDYLMVGLLPVPNHWEIILFNPKTSKLTQSYVANLDTHAIGNPIDPSRFRLDYPDGTDVIDFTNGSRYKLLEGDKKFLVENNSSPKSRWFMVAAIIALTVALIVVGLGLRKARRAHSPAIQPPR